MTNINPKDPRDSFGPRDHGASLPVQGLTPESEIARINLRGTSYLALTIIGDLTCRVFRTGSDYNVCVFAKDHTGFEGCGYEVCASNKVGMLAMNDVLEQMRADCEWLDSLPEKLVHLKGRTGGGNIRVET